jgi:hypothetical protein
MKQRIIAANISLGKEIAIWEKLKLQLRFDYQNRSSGLTGPA